MPQPILCTPPASIDSNDSRNILSPSSSSCSPPHELLLYNYQDLTRTSKKSEPYLKIIEQPIDGFRFRYRSEMTGTHGALGGISSTRSKKNCFPAVQLVNFDKPAEIRCSLYQVGPEEEREPHAHRLVMKDGNTECDDPHTIKVSKEDCYIATFSGMGILHTARTYVVDELVRKKVAIRDFEQCGKQINKVEEVKIKNEAEIIAKTINLNVVCLRFDAYAQNSDGTLVRICKPVYSNKINNLKSALTGDLKIVRFSKASCQANGNCEIFMLVEKVTKKNIKIRFFEMDPTGEYEVWSEYGRFSEIDVHHQYAIVFRPPPYKNLDIDRKASVLMELVRPSDGARSEPKEFSYTPCDNYSSRKRPKVDDSSSYSMDLPATIQSLSSELENFDMNLVGKLMELPDPFSSAELNELCNSSVGQSYCSIFQPEFGNILGNVAECQQVPGQASFIQPDGGGGTSIKEGATKSTSVKQKFQTSMSSPMPTNEELKSVREPDLIVKIKDIFHDLISMLKSNPSASKIQVILRANIQKGLNENGDTIIHVCILYGLNRQLSFLFTLIKNYKVFDIIDTTNKSKMTPLHAAAAVKNFAVITTLIMLGAKANKEDKSGNTPLHLALREISNGDVLKMLLRHSKEVINHKNHDGDVPIFIAVRTGNADAVKMIIEAGGDINLCNATTGYTALHIAVAERNVDIVTLLLTVPTLKIVVAWNSTDPVLLAKLLLNNTSDESRNILQLLEDYVKNKNISQGVKSEQLIKEEIEDENSMDEEEEVHLHAIDTNYSSITEVVIKTKVETFESQHHLTTEVLEKLAVLLDESKHWIQLAELLDHKIFLKHNLFQGVLSPSKALLEYCLDSGDTIIQIRNFLEKLGASEAVQIIDDMIEN